MNLVIIYKKILKRENLVSDYNSLDEIVVGSHRNLRFQRLKSDPGKRKIYPYKNIINWKFDTALP